MSQKYTPLAKWIREALSDPDKGHACTQLVLLYKKSEGGTREVKTVRLGGKTWDADELAKTIQGWAETYAQDFGGISHFEIQAHYGSPDNQSHHTITVADGEIVQGGRGRTVRENPDSTGLVAQAMRHTERTMEMMTAMVQHHAAVTLQREQWMSAEMQRLREETNDAYTIVREVLMGKRKEEHEMEMQRIQIMKGLETQRKLMELIPALANTVAGKEIFPQSVADTALIEAIATKVPPEMIQQLASAGVIPAEVMGPLMARFNDVLRKKQAEVEALKKLPPAAEVNGKSENSIS